MVWQLTKRDVDDFSRNPLSSVVTELRFQPVLSIDQNSEKIAEFQEKIRSLFPTYRENHLQEVNVAGPGSFSVGSKKVFEFGNLSGTRQLRLTSGNLALVRNDHIGRADLVTEFFESFEALCQVFGNISATRLGVLYSNIINKEAISKELGVDLSWPDLINENYFPLQLATGSSNSCQFSTQISDASPEGNGELAARYSLSRQIDVNSNVQNPVFRLDIDRSEMNPKINEANIRSMIESYADDIYSLFMDVAEDKLIAWMLRKEVF